MKKWFNNVLTVCLCLLLSLLANCSREDKVVPSPPLAISNLLLDHPQYIIGTSPTFDIVGTLTFSGAQQGIKNLRVTSTLGLDLTVAVSGVQLESGLLTGVFTLEMITTPGTYSFTLWIIDGKNRSSNKLNGSFEMIVDPNKRPTAVVLQSVTWAAGSKSPQLTWTKNTDDDFSAYIVTRYFPFVSRYGFEESVEVAKISDQNVTTFFDPENHSVGFNYLYSVSVSNNKFTTESNRMEFAHPNATKISASLNPRALPLFSSSGDRMYFINDETYFGRPPTLKAISTQSNEVVRSYDFAISSPYLPLALSKNDSKLYTVLENSLMVLDASGLTVSMTIPLSFYGSRIACGRADRLYVLAYAPASVKGKIKILDATTGMEVGEIEIHDVELQSLVISPDGNTLYGVGQPMDRGLPVGRLTIYKVDISTDIGSVLTTRTASNQVQLQMSSNGQKLYIEQHFYPSTNTLLDVWSSSTLESIGQFNVSNVQGYLMSDTSLLGFTYSSDEHSPSGFYYKLTLSDLTGNSMSKFWQYFSGWSGDNAVMLFFSKDLKSLYLFDEHRKCSVIDLSL
ncbi:MAG: hypothetical protein HOP37_00295 [Cyclobacteriaceae bacterium]|nr:hypothetical protein [Cyclobacteriaceae bacterium]